MGVCLTRKPEDIFEPVRHSADKRLPGTQPGSSLPQQVDIRLELERFLAAVNPTMVGTEINSRERLEPTSQVIVQGALSKKRQKSYEDKLTTVIGELCLADLTFFGIGIACKKGLKPQSPNQDDYSVILDPSFSLFSVFDGHGTDGHEISDYVKSDLPNALASQPGLSTNPMATLSASFEAANGRLIEHCSVAGVDCELSGTTATVVLLQERTLSIAHVGDSRAVLGVRSQTRHTVQALTRDHKPETIQERTRIQNSGGEVKRLPGDVAYRVFVKNQEEPGLSVSRALGDTVAGSVGVVATPEVSQLKLDESAEYLILCSDGVWEFISNQEVLQLIVPYYK